MLEIMFPFLGGIGLFLVGMMLLSNGLVAFSGAALQQALARFTGTPLRAFWSGTLVTALMQSSTATTVTLIGFVSAGLITFTQAVGVVIGASLGNTATGWLVAGLGLKMNLGFYTLPLIGLGALLYSGTLREVDPLINALAEAAGQGTLVRAGSCTRWLRPVIPRSEYIAGWHAWGVQPVQSRRPAKRWL